MVEDSSGRGWVGRTGGGFPTRGKDVGASDVEDLRVDSRWWTRKVVGYMDGLSQS